MVISVFAGIVTGVILWLLMSPILFGLGVIAGLALALPAFLVPRIFSKPYTLWNRAAHHFGRIASTWLTGISFFVLFAVVGLTRTSLRLSRPTIDESMWVPREVFAPTAHFSQGQPDDLQSRKKNWIYLFVSWAVHSGNFWAISLLPFLMLLRAFDSGDGITSNPSGNYTLY